ncbi:lipopolysaccharide biosynthesis protein [Kribbella flavida DSM 17836]|uniref:Lipopolysaccharide biosynthesis protein n=1 Tax=Kribbella flavida (strain DSM 17836 / JCM 10339 / NBRC 14399) TaxID=479435 RepID=D2PYZ9_KRIFD|nr:LPS biosynthesis protein [Kribbella flavida]ADB31793.1 lipopolysaccharide biosynthesis protein [Kribbella flavida DSM 17836]
MSGTTETTGAVQGSRFTWSGLARRLPVIALLLAVGTGLGFLGARQQPATYTATATVLVEPADGNPYAPGTRGQNLANLGTEAQLVSSDAVAQIAKSSLRSSASVAALVEQLAVTTPPNSQVLEVAYTDITPAAARNGANAFANAYLIARERRAAQSVQAQINNLTKARTANQSALQRNLAALAKTSAGSPARVLAEQRVTTATAEASKLEAQISDLRLFQGDPGQVLSPAALPTGTAGLPSWILPVAGAAIGLLLGLVLAIVRSLNDRTLRTVDDVKAVGYPVLSTVESTSGERAEALLSDAAADLPDGARLLRSMLGVASPDGGAVLLVPAGAAGPHTTTPLALAAALARADQTVTLVDTDGDLTRATGLADADGVAEVLNEDADPDEVATQYQENLRFVPVGPRYSSSVDKLASPQMRSFLEGLAPDSHWVLVAGPIASAPEALTLADLCTDVIILVSLRQTTAADLQHAAEAVTRGGARLVGVVVDQPVRSGLLHRGRTGDEPAHDQVDPVPAVADAVPQPVAAPVVAAPAVAAADERTEEMPVLEDRRVVEDQPAGEKTGEKAGYASTRRTV